MSACNGRTQERQELDELKARVDLAGLIEASGVALRKVGKNLLGRCPFHDDHNASLSVNAEARLWNCLGCEAGGDALRFLQLKEKLEFPQALARLRELAGEFPCDPTPTRPGPDDPLPGGLVRAELLARVAELYHQRWRESPAAQDYLRSRGLEPRELGAVFRLGYADGSLLETLPKQGASRQALTQLGVLTASGRELMQGCLVVPLEDPEQGLVGFYGRALDPEARCPHLYLPGPKRGVWNWPSVKSARRVWLVESVLDAMSLWQAGLREVTALGGTQLLPALESCLRAGDCREVVLCLDGDRPGQAATERLGGELAERGFCVFAARLPEGQDPNQLLVESGPAALAQAARSLRPLGEPAPVADSVQATEDGFVLQKGDVSYRVTPLPPFGTGKLRVLLCAQRGSAGHDDKLDLQAHRMRAATSLQVARRLELPKLEAERHLVEILRAAERWVKDHQAEADSGPGGLRRLPPPPMSAAEREEALAFLRAPDLAERILADAEALGFVGEENNKLLTYLVGTSRKQDRPMAAIMRSGSGAGKSTLAELAEQLMPPEDVVPYTRLSAQALFNMSADAVKHKVLKLEERTGAEGADYSIRALLSSRRLVQAVVHKCPTTGRLTTRENEVEGPIAYLETTTSLTLNHENATRCFELYVDESEEQTRRIFEAQRARRRVTEHDQELRAEAIRARHHRAQRLLEKVCVFIPFVDQLDFPSRWLRTRRDHERFLCLIEAVAFLHQFQRRRGQTVEGTPYILAELADYRLAYRLAEQVLGGTLHELGREARELWEFLVGWTAEQNPACPTAVIFSRRQLREATRLQDHRLRAALAELVEMEYVAKQGGATGQTFQYQLLVTQTAANPLGALTTPAELERRLGG